MIIQQLNDISQQLIEAIETSDWSIVADVISELSGHEVEVEEDSLSQIKAMQKQLEDMMLTLNKPSSPPKKSTATKKQVKKKTSKSQKTETNQRVNKFDEIYESIKGDVGKEAGYDLIDDTKKQHVKLRRPKYEAVEAKCTECGKVRSMNPSLVKNPYVCDRCVASRIRR